jgi:hypothetical protein
MNPENPDRTFPIVERWRSREEIRRDYLDSLTPEQLRQVDSSYYWYKYGLPAVQREQARKFDADQPRVPAGNPDGGQWTSGAAGMGEFSTSFAAARRRGGSPAYCMAQYAVDALTCNAAEPASRRATCWRQAAERLGNCLAGRPIPPLTF